MASINYAAREISVKIVYYGPGLSGKTTNLQVIHKKVPPDFKSDMVSLATETDRTLFFDFLPLDLGKIKGFATKFQLYTVPGQVYYNATRKLVLRGVDGVVFVADSGADKIQENLESFQNLEDNLAEYGYQRESIPIILQYNKRDLPNAMSIEEMQMHVNKYNLPYGEAIAYKGVGVFDTLKQIGKIVIDHLNKKYSKGGSRAEAPEAPRAQAQPPRPQAAPAARPAAPQPPQYMPPQGQQQFSQPQAYKAPPAQQYTQPPQPPQYRPQPNPQPQQFRAAPPQQQPRSFAQPQQPQQPQYRPQQNQGFAPQQPQQFQAPQSQQYNPQQPPQYRPQNQGFVPPQPQAPRGQQFAPPQQPQQYRPAQAPQAPRAPQQAPWESQQQFSQQSWEKPVQPKTAPAPQYDFSAPAMPKEESSLPISNYDDIFSAPAQEAQPIQQSYDSEPVDFEPMQPQYGAPVDNSSSEIEIESFSRPNFNQPQSSDVADMSNYSMDYNPANNPFEQQQTDYETIEPVSPGRTDLDMEIEKYQREIEEKQKKMRTSQSGETQEMQSFSPSSDHNPYQSQQSYSAVQPEEEVEDIDVFMGPQQDSAEMSAEDSDDAMYFTSIDRDRQKKPVKRPVNPKMKGQQQQKGFLSKLFNKDNM